MKRFYIIEDNQTSRFRVIFSKDIRTKISVIHTYNQNNNKALSQWYEYIEGIVDYISNPSIAWDYANQHTVYKNGTRFMSTFNYNVGYSVKTNANGAYVYIFQVNLNPQAFGLKVPPSLRESKYNSRTIRLTKDNFVSLIKESVINGLKDEFDYKKTSYEAKPKKRGGLNDWELFNIIDGIVSKMISDKQISNDDGKMLMHYSLYNNDCYGH